MTTRRNFLASIVAAVAMAPLLVLLKRKEKYWIIGNCTDKPIAIWDDTKFVTIQPMSCWSAYRNWPDPIVNGMNCVARVTPKLVHLEIA